MEEMGQLGGKKTKHVVTLTAKLLLLAHFKTSLVQNNVNKDFLLPLTICSLNSHRFPKIPLKHTYSARYIIHTCKK